MTCPNKINIVILKNSAFVLTHPHAPIYFAFFTINIECERDFLTFSLCFLLIPPSHSLTFWASIYIIELHLCLSLWVKQLKRSSRKMRNIFFVVFLVLCVAFATAQLNYQNNGQQFPNFKPPNFDELCKQPGANCVSQVCDTNGNCKTVRNGAVTLVTASNFFLIVCSVILKMYL